MRICQATSDRLGYGTGDNEVNRLVSWALGSVRIVGPLAQPSKIRFDALVQDEIDDRLGYSEIRSSYSLVETDKPLLKATEKKKTETLVNTRCCLISMHLSNW